MKTHEVIVRDLKGKEPEARIKISSRETPEEILEFIAIVAKFES